MPKYRETPLTLAAIWQDGPPVRPRDLSAATGLSGRTIRREIELRALKAARVPRRRTAYLIERAEAWRWLRQLGYAPPRAMTAMTAIATPPDQPAR